MNYYELTTNRVSINWKYKKCHKSNETNLWGCFEDNCKQKLSQVIIFGICSLNLKYQYIVIYNYKFDTKISLQKTIYEKTV